PRTAMVIAVSSFALSLDPARRRVGTGIGSAGPTPLRAVDAEAFIAGELDWDGRRPPSDATLSRFGELVAAAAKPIDDVRGTAAYRRHALAVVSRRCLAWAWATPPALRGAGARRGPGGRSGGGPGTTRPPTGVGRCGRGPVRLLHAGFDRRHARSAAAGPAALRRADPRGAGGQCLPLHRLREDHRGREHGGAMRV